MEPDLVEKYLLEKNGCFKFCKRKIPRPDNGWVQIRFLYCGICGSDLSVFNDFQLAEKDKSLGHEFVGEVIQVGEFVDIFRVGDIVTSDFNVRCGECSCCANHLSHMCDLSEISRFSNRAFATKGNILAKTLFKASRKNIRALTITEPLSCIIHALDQVKFSDEKNTLVVGLGGLGLCFAFAIETQRPSLRVDFYDNNRMRSLKLSDCVSLQRGKFIEKVDEKYSIVFDLSGTLDGLLLAAQHVMKGGTLISLSHIKKQKEMSHFFEIVKQKDVWFKMSYLNGERINMKIAIDLIENNWDDRWNRLLEVYPIKLINEAFSKRLTSPINKTIIKI